MIFFIYIAIGLVICILMSDGVCRGFEAASKNNDITIIQRLILIFIFIIIWPYILYKFIKNTINS